MGRDRKHMEYFTCSLFDKAGISINIKNSVQDFLDIFVMGYNTPKGL